MPGTSLSKNEIVILGASGMLGAMVLDLFAADNAFQVTATVRDTGTLERFRRWYPSVDWRLLDAESADNKSLDCIISKASWIINCIGIIKPFIHDDNQVEIERAIRVNALFPQLLARSAASMGVNVLQIATDCVYSGTKGAYLESDIHDALDVYGKTKSLGEPFLGNVHSLRCSIIGPEPKCHVSLLDWFRRQPESERVNGFTNHLWNGITTLHFARLCRGIIAHSLDMPRIQHIVPTGTITKAAMLKCFAKAYAREDIKVIQVDAKTVIDRTLATNDTDLNILIWKSAGYGFPPDVPQMIAEMGSYYCKWQEVGQ